MENVYEEHNLLFTTYSTADSHATFLFENLAPRTYRGVIYVYVQILYKYMYRYYISICTEFIVMLYKYMYRYYSDVI